MARFAVLLSLATFLIGSLSTAAQTVSDPTAVSLAARSITAMTGGTPVLDVGMTGTATSFAGSDIETGTATLLGKGTTESLVALNLTEGKRIEIRNSLAGVPRGKWSNNDGTSGLYAWHNSWTDAVWFYPVLSALASSANSMFLFSYIGQESLNTLAVQHLRVVQLVAANTSSLLPVQRVSTRDIFLDSLSLLPVVIDFKVHPDNDMNVDIGEEIRFADYRAVNGIQIPFHVQRLINGGLTLDVVVTSVRVNSGLSDIQFSF